MRSLLAVAAAGLGLLVLPASAVPKEGVHAVATAKVDIAVKPGRLLRVPWRLEDAEGKPFGAGGIYLRVHRCGRPALKIPALELGGGHYTAKFRVRGRIRKLTVGLEGWRTAGGRTTRADVFFDFVPAIGRRCT